MDVANINSERISQKIKPVFLDVLAKKSLLKVLTHIKRGRLVIDDGGELLVFGDEVECADTIAHVIIHHPSAYRDIVLGGSIGAGEAYMRGLWSSTNLLDVIRLMVMNLSVLNGMDNRRPIISRLASRFSHLVNANTKSGARKNIAAHYDLGNEFFNLFLDPTMMYSSAIYPNAGSTLEQASLHKLDTVCQKLQLSENDHLMEVGTGWGGLAIYAAKNYGCRVTTTTISQQQYDYACAAVKREGLQDRVTLLLEDYRNLTGTFDKLVSIEMIEAVGHEYYDSYFEKCSSLLKDDGLMLIQAITIADQRYDDAKRSVDFIQRYIFPGGCLPSNEVIARCVARKTDMMIVDLHDIGIDYARTLADWRKRFLAYRDDVKKLGFDEIFIRMWEFYLCYCEGGFAERAISTVQVVFAKPGARSMLARQ